MRLRRCRGPEFVDGRVIGRALDPAVPRAIVALAVLVVLAVGLVVLLVVRGEVGQREPVVGGHEVDAGGRRPAVRGVDVATACHPQGELAQQSFLTPPEVAHLVAVLPVPLGPSGRESAHLIAREVPRFRDELHRREDGILMDQVEERTVDVLVPGLPGERGRQVEAEPVDMHVSDPVPQGIHNEAKSGRMADIQAVPGTRRVEVVLPLPVDETVVRRIVEAFEGQCRPEMVAFGRVVVDHIENDLETGAMQCFDHRLEFVDLFARGPSRAVAAVGGQEPDAVVSPVVPGGQGRAGGSHGRIDGSEGVRPR